MAKTPASLNDSGVQEAAGKPAAKEKYQPPIVGIGASAGGLEAMEQFFSHLPPVCGAAFVVVQHLDPTQQGMLPELLQRYTAMPVAQAREAAPIKADCVYVIPPNKDLSILHGKLHLLEPSAPRGLRLPIDYFFRALALDQRQQAVGLILSGMGSDGSLGLRAIKENAGLALVQSPESAKFDAMPRSAIDAGLADVIAPPEELATRLIDFLHRNLPHLPQTLERPLELKAQSALEKIIVMLRDRTGNDFSLYKRNTIYRRIERRMGLHQLDTIDAYVRYLSKNSQELDLLFKELLIGVTNFFRDPEIWEYLKNTELPTLLAEYPGGRELRAWVPACSTGEEAYTLAMIFKEALSQTDCRLPFKLQIFATDLDQDAIEKARQGYYPANIAADVSPERLARFFVAEDSGYRIKKEIREMVIFARQNLVMDPPFTKLDLLSCRNLLIYLGQELQKKLIPLFHYALSTHGLLLLGNSESTSHFNTLFANLHTPSRLYRRIERPLTAAAVDFPSKYFPVPHIGAAETAPDKAVANLQSQVDQLLLQNYAPAAVVVNGDGDILYINGRTGKYLEPAAGKANWNIHAMARDGLRHELGSALKQARQQAEPVLRPGLNIAANGGGHQFNLAVQAIAKPEALAGLLIVVFNDLPLPRRKTQRRAPNAAQQALQEELQQAREELQTLREEMQTSQEELKSANEELQSTNEELQSTNEELTTSKEEMQSLNEELQTMNAELQSKVNDLSWMNNDMKNLLNSMEIATVFLDNALHIRRFTSHATQLFKLIAGDVGRPLSDIATSLDYPKLQQDAQDVLNTLVFCEKLIKTLDGKSYKVRIMPYRTQENVIDGVVITLIDAGAT